MTHIARAAPARHGMRRATIAHAVSLRLLRCTDLILIRSGNGMTHPTDTICLQVPPVSKEAVPE